MNKIVLNDLYKKEMDETSRLIFKVTKDFNGESVCEEYYIEVEKKWGKYFVTESADAFVLAFIELALENQADLVFSIPMSEEMKYQIETYYIPVIINKIPQLYSINLVGPSQKKIFESGHAVGTGFSAGVDSFYSVLKHLNCQYDSRKLTHLVLAVNGAASTGYSENLDKEWLDEEIKRFEPLAKELGLDFIWMSSNFTNLQRMIQYNKGGSVLVTSVFIYSLNKLFGTYYWASGYSADLLNFEDVMFMEPFLVPTISTNSLKFYHSGSETNRIGKVKYISNNRIAQKGLTVCGQPDNCGYCFKCLRTMAELYSIGKLDDFKEVFPVGNYKKHKYSFIGRELAADHAPYTTEIIDELKKNKLFHPIPIYFFKWFVYNPYYAIKKLLRNNKTAMKIYYGKGLDLKLEGTKHHNDYIEARLSGKAEI
jgi:hypothetical protein